jgi:hypothetical protein
METMEMDWRSIAAWNANRASNALRDAMEPVVAEIIGKYEAELERVRLVLREAPDIETARRRLLK